ncbi:sulfatase [Bacteroidota bacterium]
MKVFYLSIVTIVIIGFLGSCSGQNSRKAKNEVAGKQDEKKQLNILFIAIDDLRPELGTYGSNHIISPNIDQLAKEGVQFNKAYCQAPHCLPSRASMLTGIQQTQANLFIEIEKYADNAPTLPETFRNAGYHTLCNGKIFHQNENMAEKCWSEPPFSLVNGPDENNHLTFHDSASAKFILKKNNRGPFYEAPDVPDSTYIDGQTCNKVIRDLKRLSKMDKPFFLACGFVRPHLPFYAPKKYWDLYDRDKIELAKNNYIPKGAPKSLNGSGEFKSYHDRNIEYNSQEFQKIAKHGYYACVSYVDTQVGRLLATLDELGLKENTIVVLWGDHGWNLGEHSFWSKHNLLHTSKNAPLIISAPGLNQGVKTDGIVEFIDIYPTLCELTGLDLPKHLDGQSLVQLMENPDKKGKEAAYTFWGKGKSITTIDFSYTEYNNGERMLFDLNKDPNENVNVAKDSAYIETCIQLSELLNTKM